MHAGRAHTDFAEAKLQRRLIEGRLEDAEIDALAVVSLAGAAAESMQYEEVCNLPGETSWIRCCSADGDRRWCAGDWADGRPAGSAAHPHAKQDQALRTAAAEHHGGAWFFVTHARSLEALCMALMSGWLVHVQRMAVYEAASLLKQWNAEYLALQQTMQRGGSIVDCVRAIEEA